MPPLKSIPLFALAVLAFGHPAAAQQESDEITRRFSIIAWGQPIRDVFFRTGERDVAIRAFPRRRSEIHRYTGPRELVFFRKKENAAGETVRQPMGRFRFEGDAQAWLLLLREERDGNLRVAGFPANAPEADDPGYRFINLSSEPVAGLLAGETFRLGPGQSHSLAPPSDAENGSARVKFALRRAETWELFYETFWPVRPDQRWIVLVHTDGDRLRLTKIKERLNTGDK